MKLVRAGLRDQIHLAADRILVLGGNYALNRTHLLDAFDAHDVHEIGRLVYSGAVGARVSTGVRSVERPLRAVCPDAVHIHPGRASSARNGARYEDEDAREISVL